MAPNPYFWTAERAAALTTLWNEGVSSGDIAAALGITRNAVMGKVWRLKLRGRERSRRTRKQVNATAQAALIKDLLGRPIIRFF
jgi:GcrA cell cycle regulator